jgi:hypothetical protein
MFAAMGGRRPSSTTKKEEFLQIRMSIAQLRLKKNLKSISVFPFRENILRKTAWTAPECFLFGWWRMG